MQVSHDNLLYYNRSQCYNGYLFISMSGVNPDTLSRFFNLTIKSG